MLLLHLGEVKPPQIMPRRCAGTPCPAKPAVHLELTCRWEAEPEASCAPGMETKTRPVANYGRKSSAGFLHAHHGEPGGVGRVGFCSVNRSLPGVLGESEFTQRERHLQRPDGVDVGLFHGLRCSRSRGRWSVLGKKEEIL